MIVRLRLPTEHEAVAELRLALGALRTADGELCSPKYLSYLDLQRADFALGSFMVRLHLAAGRIPAIEAKRVLAALSTIRAILDPRTALIGSRAPSPSDTLRSWL